MSKLKIGEKIRSNRRERNLTQEELANTLGVSKAAVSKWENNESYPDITILPQIAQLFHITMDELFGYTLEYTPLRIVNEYHFGLSLDDVDKRVLDYGTIKDCGIYKTKDMWEVRVHFISTEDEFPYVLQKYVKPGVLIDGYSVRHANGKVIDDDKPNKHYVCSNKVWEYRNTNVKFLQAMLKEQVDIGLIKEDADV